MCLKCIRQTMFFVNFVSLLGEKGKINYCSLCRRIFHGFGGSRNMWLLPFFGRSWQQSKSTVPVLIAMSAGIRAEAVQKFSAHKHL